ncbi:MAG: hypothetical protein KKF24_16445 [Gammaproteobacteria bacterium]|nr:hypothetical protein [Gammaproteobacteria bacterium]MBU1834276.1 hypothetical protein [Gammaproteobacteria bacterium]
MKRFLDHRSKRFGFDGWALKVKGSKHPLAWSACTTRGEARSLRNQQTPDLFQKTEIVKVKISVEVVSD